MSSTESKLMSMSEAVSRLVTPGLSVALGTSLEGLIPFAAGHEIIRQGVRDLTLIGPISDMLFDQMIGGGCVSRIRAAWVGNVSTGAGYFLRRAFEQGRPLPLEIENHSNFTIALALEAGALGVPYLPARTLLGSDIIRDNPAFRIQNCPFTGSPLLLVGAIEPDLAVVHVQRADPQGNAHLWGNMGVSRAAARAAKKVLLITEEIVDPEVIRNDPGRTVIPGFAVTAVVEEPWGAHPSAVQGYYGHDDPVYLEYAEATRTESGGLAWLEKWVYSRKSRREYLEGMPADRLKNLQVCHSAPAAPAEFGY